MQVIVTRKIQNEDYLAHHGIKGQKWGVRRFQNKDGTRTAEGKKRYGDYDPTGKAKLPEKQQREIAKDVVKHFKKDPSYLGGRALVNDNQFVNDLHNKSQLKFARKELDKYSDLAKEYDSSKDIQYKYKIKAMSKWQNESEESLKSKYDKNDVYLMYEDWDQGYGSSFDLYLQDKGTNFDDFNEAATKALDKYKQRCLEEVDAALGSYANTKVNRKFSWEEKTVRAAIADSLVDYAEDEKRLYYRYL